MSDRIRQGELGAALILAAFKLAFAIFNAAAIAGQYREKLSMRLIDWLLISVLFFGLIVGKKNFENKNPFTQENPRRPPIKKFQKSVSHGYQF